MANVFNLSIPQLSQWSRRQKPDHRQLNEPVETLNRLVTGIGPPRPLALRSNRAIGVPVPPVLLAADAGMTEDHLVCRAIDSDAEDEYTPILVAKPWLLRVTPHNSLGPDDVTSPTRGDVRYVYDTLDSTKRIAYDINDPPDTPEDRRNKRDEIISPQYLPDRMVEELFIPGDELRIATLAPPMTIAMTVVIEEEETLVDVPISLVDVTGGRAWAVVYEQL